MGYFENKRINELKRILEEEVTQEIFDTIRELYALYNETPPTDAELRSKVAKVKTSASPIMTAEMTVLEDSMVYDFLEASGNDKFIEKEKAFAEKIKGIRNDIKLIKASAVFKEGMSESKKDQLKELVLQVCRDEETEIVPFPEDIGEIDFFTGVNLIVEKNNYGLALSMSGDNKRYLVESPSRKVLEVVERLDAVLNELAESTFLHNPPFELRVKIEQAILDSKKTVYKAFKQVSKEVNNSRKKEEASSPQRNI